MNSYSRRICETLQEDTFDTVKVVNTLRKIKLDIATPANTVGEFFSNVTLAYRHLEDAHMRLGNAIQALDKPTTQPDNKQNE